MELAVIGLGKMGANMVKRLLKGGHCIIAYDLSEANIKTAEGEGAIGAYSLNDVIAKLTAPRIIWVMVPEGAPTEKVINSLAELLQPGDIIIDGGNSNYKDSIRRAAGLKEKGLNMIDVGTSGGVWGLENGYSLMIGGDQLVVSRLKPIFETLAPSTDHGWGHVGPCGSGHFVKMIHNGIEYGLMQAYAEGFELLQSKTEFNLDLLQISHIWQHGSVVRSWLLDLAANAFEENPTLDGIAAYVPDSGEGRWTVAEAIDLRCSIPVITMALERRFRSRQNAPFSDKLLAALRQQFGGHDVKKDS